MKEWLTAAEIAGQELPGVPSTKSAMIRFAERAGWADSAAYVRNRAGRGGGLEYNIALLPPLARIAYERRHRRIEALAPQAPAAVGPASRSPSTDLSDRAAIERDARLAIVTAYRGFSVGQRLSETSRTKIFVDAYNAGSLAIEPWIREIVPALSPRTLARWRAARAAGRTETLAVDRGAARKGKGVLDVAAGGRVRTFLLALIAQNPHLSAQHLRQLIRSEFGDTLDCNGKAVPVPPVRTIQHVVARLKQDEHVALTKLSNPDRYRSIMAPSGVGTYRWVVEPNTLWMIDASPVDALCVDGRHTIYAAIDIATRRTVLYVSRTPRASAVALLIRKAIIAWGVPDKIKTDNGSDFVARDTQRLFASLGIEMELSDPYQPQQKAFVERVIKTFQHDCATLLPGFVGHSVADRKAIEDRKSFAERLGEDAAEAFGVSLTGAALQAVVDRWVETVYAEREHAALKTSPRLAAAASKRPVRTVDPRALDLLLMPVAGGDGFREVTKLGVRVDGFHYVVMEALPGDRVLVRMDPVDAGRIYAFDADDGRFVGEGLCPELAGIDPAALMAAKRAAQAEIISDATREARKVIRDITKGPALIERVLTVAERDKASAAAAASNVITLPKRSEAHETPAITAARDAMAPRPIEPPTPSADVLAMQAKLIAEDQVVRPLRSEETPHQRWKRALDLIARIAAGEPVPADEAMWLGGYRAGPEFKGFAMTYGDPMAQPAETKSPAASWHDATGQSV
ncbi:DDE-type integrase/transposase/recombinase [Rhodoplanes sp. TEM]|uniref:DDE-type integrase/transposase/recombinase n=1 Tax=Rhodoplanes tepidamans TaxID=200616 RepID=A0ABT5JCB5_RHOTP|nr:MULTISPECIES: DDE-type integrase/transposase/recombinase [Rhodoplanes]MDC7787330.1 DDE-type integrase/transposase/recombinase [Rhodoplanes tepidamans]MDC7984788.1 DDE-type integrase/transposase/recombinase [Rhodoplanes sp. TEM]MDQ0358241.1 transposase InsO family protein [Rhodoplanes tepidamans]